VSDAESPPEQLELGQDYASQVDAAGVKILSAIAAAIDASGKRGDGFAEQLRLDPAQLSRALNGRGAHFSVRWLPAVLWGDPEHRVIRRLAAMAGGEFVPKPKRTREDENEAVRVYLEKRAGEVGRGLITQALEDAP
jgi:hypothetical protein